MKRTAIVAFFCLMEFNTKAQEINIPSSLLGFNTNTAFFYCRSQTESTWNDCQTWFDTINPGVIRFPGGAIANYYHFQWPHYGLREIEIKNDPEEAKEWRRNPLDGDENVIVRLAALVAPRKTPVLFVLNMFTDDYAQNKNALQYLLDQKVVLAGVELGNQLYLDQYQSKYPTPEAYLADAQKWASNLRRDFPGLKIGIVGAPLAETKGITPAQIEKYQKWNALTAQNKDYDAVTVQHFLAFDCPNEGRESKTCLGRVCQTEFQQTLPAFFKQYGQLFPSKKLWVTDWNFTPAMFRHRTNPVHLLFLARTWLEWAQLSTQENAQLEIAIGSPWISEDAMLPMVAPKFSIKLDPHGVPPIVGTDRLAVLRMVAPLFDGTAATLPTATWKTAIENLPEDMESLAFQRQGKTIWLMFNWGEQARSLDRQDNLSDETLVTTCMRAFNGELKINKAVFGERFTIPPYSFILFSAN